MYSCPTRACICNYFLSFSLQNRRTSRMGCKFLQFFTNIFRFLMILGIRGLYGIVVERKYFPVPAGNRTQVAGSTGKHSTTSLFFYSDVVECLPLDPAAQVRFPPRAVGIFLHPVTFGGQYVGPWLGFRASRWKYSGITA